MSRTNGRDALDLRVTAIRYEADAVLSFELRAPDDGELPPFSAGAHVDLSLPNGLVRSYSLCNSECERDRYVIGVQRDPNSRGGSAYLHDRVRPGDTLAVTAPRNNFGLDPGDAPSVLIAGGIGVTPLLSMVRALQQRQRTWILHYAVRERRQLAFQRALRGLAGDADRVRVHVDAENGGAVLDLPRIVAEAPEGAHFYCCGPAPMLDAFAAATSGIPSQRTHVEHFTNTEAPDTSGGYEIELAASGLVLEVKPGKTILQTIEAAGVSVIYSCTEGVCGTCETRVLGGMPEHRDQVLTDREKAANDVMMICCSGSRSPRLVLDL